MSCVHTLQKKIVTLETFTMFTHRYCVPSKEGDAYAVFDPSRFPWCVAICFSDSDMREEVMFGTWC